MLRLGVHCKSLEPPRVLGPAKNWVTRTEADIPYCDLSTCKENGAAPLSSHG
jgi:hypothetical protein